jgi:hypothetical protein
MAPDKGIYLIGFFAYHLTLKEILKQDNGAKESFSSYYHAVRNQFIPSTPTPEQPSFFGIDDPETHTPIFWVNIIILCCFDYTLSAEDAKRYKPFREPYTMTSRRLGIFIKDTCLVSSNLWDIAGGRAVGMQTCCITVVKTLRRLKN